LFSNEIDESDLHCEKHDEQRISAFAGIVIDLIGWVSKERRPMIATHSQRGEEGGCRDANLITITEVSEKLTREIIEALSRPTRCRKL
jgi:hypothetical protein